MNKTIINILLLFVITSCSSTMYSESYYYRAKTNFCKKQYKLAIENFTKSIEYDPNNDNAYVNRGIAYVISGDENKAYQDFNKAIELNEHSHRAFCNMGFYWLKNNDNEKAISNLEHAIEIEPKHIDAYYRLGLVWEKSGDITKALSYFLEAISIDPNYHPPYNSAAWILATSNLPEIRDGEKAIKLAQKAVEFSSNSKQKSMTLDTLAAAYAADNQFQLAVETQTLAISTLTTGANDEIIKDYENRMLLYNNEKQFVK